MDHQQFDNAEHGNSPSGQAHRVNYMWVDPFDIMRDTLLLPFFTPLIVSIWFEY
jgi:hypothetical protein